MRLIWYPAVTLDGFIATAEGNSDWVIPDDDRLFTQLVQSAGAIVMGRRTFDQYHSHGNPFPKAKTYVLTNNHHLASNDPAVAFVTGGPLEVMRRLHADGYQQAVLSGGGDTNGLFARAGLIEEAWISVYPLTLGAGIPLFGGYPTALRLTLIETRELPGGVTHHRYEVG